MKKTLLFFLATVCIYTISVIFARSVMTDLSDNILRLHIIANSNSEIDQQVKLDVRQAVLEADINLDDEVLAVKNLRRIESAANKVLAKNGFLYGAKANFGKFYFPEKAYDNITIPKGRYKSINLVLGEGKGKNWWCVLSTPICLADNTVEYDNSALKEKLNEQTFAIISDENKYSLKILELIRKIF